MAKSKKKGKRKDEEEGEEGFSIGVSQETRNSIAGIFCFLIVIVSILAFIGKAGTAGVYFNLTTRSLFGWGFFIVPIAFSMLGIAFIRSIHRQIAKSALFGTLLFVLSVLGVFYSIGDGDSARRLIQGGYLGLGLGWPLFTFLGFWATMVILVGLVVVSVLLTLDVPIYQLFMRSSEEEDAVKEKEMSEKDMEANSKYLQRVEEQDKLPDMVTDEINKLIGLTQAGNLRVIVDEKSEKIEDEDDLLNPDPDYWKDKK